MTLEEIVTALREGLDDVPPVDANCHSGITTQDKCGHCSRLIAAYAAVEAIKPLVYAARLEIVTPMAKYFGYVARPMPDQFMTENDYANAVELNDTLHRIVFSVTEEGGALRVGNGR